MTTVAFIINGGRESAMGYRARALAAHLRERYDISFAYREGNKVAALLRFLMFLLQVKPQVAYVFDMSYSGVLGAWLYRLFSGHRLVVETGDAIYELMRSTGNRGPLGLWLTYWFERFSLRAADRIVVRGRYHRQWLEAMGLAADVIQDGVDTREFMPLKVDDLRRQYELDGVLTVGLVGSSVWSEKLGMCYGWELVETLSLLKHEAVKGVIIGDGSGISRLKARCRECEIEDKVLFLGHVPYEQLPRYLNLIDVCLSTQTDDLAGRVRTTGKLPLYLATGRYVLASEVGEAALVLDREMLLPYEGVTDRRYPQRLAERVETILADPQRLERAVAANVALAKEYFEYSKLALALGAVIESVMRPGERPEAAAEGRATAQGQLDRTVMKTGRNVER
jgi:glycosyltransferase involved in cell wall biosynthesis